ncbi:hypothetical protein [uncultured Kordia sp.]|uniref:hypothetical protein n=1 Tax=uncultured Kordia sp. TaxID=507699 RepID=UPI00261F42A7|nr:hypothetical protein [uncultured Kordia sp.]
MKIVQEIQIKSYEEKLHDLLGKSIMQVNYYELKYDEPLWDEKTHHSLDFGIEIVTNENKQYYFIWGQEFTQFDVKFEKGDILKEFASIDSFNKYDVANTSYWKLLKGKAIKSIHVSWSYWSFLERKEKHYYPQDVIIVFEDNKKVIISALEMVDGKAVNMKDHISVFFDEELFRKIKNES